MLLSSILEGTRSTPTLLLNRYCASKGVKGSIGLKLECLSPGGSKKDRVAAKMIEVAKRDGSLRPGRPVVELTSGNTGAGLALACRAHGHEFYAIMSSGNSIERAKMMRAFGANVVLVPQAKGSLPGKVSAADLELVEAEAKKVVKELDAFRADQFSLESNEAAHYEGTAPEIWNVFQPNAFVDFAGTGGTFSGCAKFFKERDSNIECVWAEPPQKSHRIQGGGYFTSTDGFSPLKFEVLAEQRGHIDRKMVVSDIDAEATAKELARIEGVLGGFSTGANVWCALQLLREKNSEDFAVCCIANDTGLKYMSTDLYKEYE